MDPPAYKGNVPDYDDDEDELEEAETRRRRSSRRRQARLQEDDADQEETKPSALDPLLPDFKDQARRAAGDQQLEDRLASTSTIPLAQDVRIVEEEPTDPRTLPAAVMQLYPNSRINAKNTVGTVDRPAAENIAAPAFDPPIQAPPSGSSGIDTNAFSMPQPSGDQGGGASVSNQPTGIRKHLVWAGVLLVLGLAVVVAVAVVLSGNNGSGSPNIDLSPTVPPSASISPSASVPPSFSAAPSTPARKILRKAFSTAKNQSKSTRGDQADSQKNPNRKDQTPVPASIETPPSLGSAGHSDSFSPFVSISPSAPASPTNLSAPPNSTNQTELTALGQFLEIQERDVQCPLSGAQNHPEPVKQLGDYMEQKTGKVFSVGDSVIGQVAILGRPGLCCNPRVRCDDELIDLGGQDPNNDGSFYGELNATHYGSLQTDWQHLKIYIGRGKTYFPPVYHLAPAISAETNAADGGAGLVAETIKNMSANKNDILIMGLMGNHFHNHEQLLLFETYCTQLITRLVNPFPGRVILVDTSPQHFKGNGAYAADGIKECGPLMPGLDKTPGVVEMRQAIWDYVTYKNLNHNNNRVIDLFSILDRLWMCHRYPVLQEGTSQPVDCTHWNDGVYSVVAGLVLEALQSLEDEKGGLPGHAPF